MSRKANPAAVGLFVVLAVTLLVAAVIVFGKGRLFKETRDWVLYFDGSIKGLSTGSAVVFQGVRIGEVKDIRVRIDKEGHIRTPVIMTLDASLIDIEEQQIDPREALESTKRMIERGLRAQLQTQSLITGQLLIQLGFHPDKEARYAAPDDTLPEMPTIPSAVQELSNALEKLPLKEIVDNIHSITENLGKLLSSGEISRTLASLAQSIESAEKVLIRIDQEIQPLSADARKVLHSADAFLADNNQKVGTLLTDLEKTSATTRQSIEQITADLTDVTRNTETNLAGFLQNATALSAYAEKMISDQSELRIETSKTIEEFRASLRSLRMLTEYLEQHPEALLRGKKEQ
jgi:paraquat-inducible protein B